jgi:thiol:disulfide interchange protein
MNESRKPLRMPHFLVLGVVILLVMVILMLKDMSKPEATASTGVLPEKQLEQAVRAGRPALAFFHSTSCDQCIKMIKTVGEVFPEFDESVDLVDVNVYDSKNELLLDRVGVELIPMLVFYDRYGQPEKVVGVMEADVLRQHLSALLEEP